MINQPSVRENSWKSFLSASSLMKILLFQAVLIFFFFAWNNQLQNQVLNKIENAQPTFNIPGTYKSSGTGPARKTETNGNRVLQQTGSGNLLPSEIAENINQRSLEIQKLESQIADLKSQIASSSRRLTSEDPDAKLYEYSNIRRGNATLQVTIPGSGSSKAVHLETKSNTENPTHLLFGSKGQSVGVGIDLPESQLHVKGKTLSNHVHSPDIKVSKSVNAAELRSSGLTVVKEGMVGVMNENPKTLVDVVGNTIFERNLDARSLIIKGRLLVEQALFINGDIKANSSDLSSLKVDKPDDDANKIVITKEGKLSISQTGSTPVESVEVQGKVVSDMLEVKNPVKSTLGQLIINSNGVGLGLDADPSPNAILAVKGSTFLKGDLINDVDSVTSIGSLLVGSTGKVAIGGPVTSDQLAINGNFNIIDGDINVRTNTVSNIGVVKVSNNGNVGIGQDPDSGTKRLISAGSNEVNGDMIVSVTSLSNLGPITVDNKNKVVIGGTGVLKDLSVYQETYIANNLEVQPKTKSMVTTGSTTIMNVLADGRVGIGKMPEDHQFEVGGDAKVNGLVDVAVNQLSQIGPLKVNRLGRVGFMKTPLKNELDINGDMAVSKEMTVINPNLSNLGQIFFRRSEENGVVKERVGFGAVAYTEIAEVVGNLKITSNIMVDGSDKSYVNSMLFPKSENNVGIGLYKDVIPDTSNALHVNGTTIGSNAIRVDGNTKSQVFSMTVKTTDTKVGINKEDPSYELHVVGGAQVTGNLLTTGTTASVVGPVKFFSNNAKIEMKNTAADSTNTKGVYIGGDVLITKDLNTPSASDVTFGTNFYVRNSKFGIYNDNPTYQLDVNGKTRVSKDILSDGSATDYSQFGEEVQINQNGMAINTPLDSSFALKVSGSFRSLDIKFAPNLASSIGQLTQSKDGLFGIKKVSSTSVLDVLGTMKVTKKLEAKNAVLGELTVDTISGSELVYVSDKLSIGQEIPATELHVASGNTEATGLLINELALAVKGTSRLGSWKIEKGPLSCFFDTKGKFLINAIQNNDFDLTVNGNMLTSDVVANSGLLGIFDIQTNTGVGLIMDNNKAALASTVDATATFFVDGTMKATITTQAVDNANIGESFVYTKNTNTRNYASVDSSGKLFISSKLERTPKQDIHIYGDPVSTTVVALEATKLSLKTSATIGLVSIKPFGSDGDLLFSSRSGQNPDSAVLKIDQPSKIDSDFTASTLESRYLKVGSNYVNIHRGAPPNSNTNAFWVNGEITMAGSLITNHNFNPLTDYVMKTEDALTPVSGYSTAASSDYAFKKVLGTTAHIYHSKGFAIGSDVLLTGVIPELSVDGKIIASDDVVVDDFSLKNFGYPSPLSKNAAGNFESKLAPGATRKLYIDAYGFKPFLTGSNTESGYAFLSGGSVKATGSICTAQKCLNCGFYRSVSDTSLLESYTTPKISIHQSQPLLRIGTTAGTTGVHVSGTIYSDTDVCLTGGFCLAGMKARGIRKALTNNVDGNAYLFSATSLGKLMIDSRGGLCLGCTDKTSMMKSTTPVALKLLRGTRIEIPYTSDIKYQFNGSQKSFRDLPSSVFTSEGNSYNLYDTSSNSIFKIDKTFGYIVSGSSTSSIVASGFNSDFKARGRTLGLIQISTLPATCQGKIYLFNYTGKLYMCGKDNVPKEVKVLV